MPQPFLEAGQHIDIRTGLDKNGPPSRKPDLFQGGGEHILAGDDPEHLATCASRNPGAELTGGGTVQGVIPTAGHFMKGTERQPATGQAAVDLAHAKRQHRAASVAVPFETADCGPQRLQTGFFMDFSSHVTARRSLCRRIS